MINLLEASKIVFWDFDGVIKDSVEVKTTAYVELFRPYGKEVYDRVKQHHESHGGVSRFDKIPMYLAWAGEPVNTEKVAEFCECLSQLVVQAVIDSPWVPGVYEYLLAHFKQQYFVLVTATPQQEIRYILAALDIAHCFGKCYGAPTRKTIAINDALQQLKISPSDAVMIGDSDADYKAALDNRVTFVLRRTVINHHLQTRHKGAAFDNLELE
ncbi:HAD family hydrolase [Candidatus Thioglobus sp.]|nr:HAD family hydrolase [Candidatus Thioglobus sp.]